jgi:lipopolysaccharide export LptBFGC system permease protein LptF
VLKILQRYILRELAVPVLVSLAFFTLVMLLRQFFQLAEFLLNAQVSLGMILRLAGILAISLMVLTVPMALLLGILIAMGRLTTDNEILAMRAGGLSLRPILRPLHALAAAASIALLLGYATLFPSLLRNVAEEQQRMQFELLTRLRPDRFYDELSPRDVEIVLYFGSYGEAQAGDGPYTLRMKDIKVRLAGMFDDSGRITTYDSKKGDASREVLILASTGVIRGDLDSGQITLELENGTLMPLAADATEEEDTVLTFDRLTQTFSPMRDDDTLADQPETKSLGELLHVLRNPPQIPKRREGWVTMQAPWRLYYNCLAEAARRVSMPFAVLAFSLIGVPVAIQFRPAAKSLAFVLALGLIVFYYSFVGWAGAIATTGNESAVLVMILPNFVVGGLGIWLFRRMERR